MLVYIELVLNLSRSYPVNMCFQEHPNGDKPMEYHPNYYSRGLRFTLPVKINLTSRIGRSTVINLNNHWHEFEALLEPGRQQTASLNNEETTQPGNTAS
ncbi:hypothetical protein O3M35_009135 [Rhynocoris fuscipes]|uniref:Uncharacterized protein n=1 Tax=Rhynocoris fuscipes TaxID=488301 RepID=A0AAW1D7S4_9HEMI